MVLLEILGVIQLLIQLRLQAVAVVDIIIAPGSLVVLVEVVQEVQPRAPEHPVKVIAGALAEHFLAAAVEVLLRLVVMVQHTLEVMVGREPLIPLPEHLYFMPEAVAEMGTQLVAEQEA